MVFDFLTRKRKVDVAPHIRRIIDLTTPNRPMVEDARYELRYNRTFPVLLNPYRNSRVILDETLVAFTRDLSDRGVGLIALAELDRDDRYVITIWPHSESLPEPYHLLASIRELRGLSMGLWIVGMEFEEALSAESGGGVHKLVEVARESLLPVNDLSGSTT